MNFFERLIAKRKFAKAKVEADQIVSLIAPLIEATGHVALHDLKRCVPSWNLSNRALLKYLGYIAGVIDAGQQCGLGKTSTDDWAATELVFHQIIEAQLTWIPGCSSFLETNRAGLEAGGTVIGGLQRLADFNEAMILGASDFLSIRSSDHFPRGICELMLFLVDCGDPENNRIEDPKPDGYLSEQNIFDRSQDHKLSDIGFFRKKCLAEIYGHCIVKDRNISDSDFVIIGTRFTNVWDSNEKSDMEHSPDEMIVRCSEPIIARCLITSGEVDFENCSEVADNVGKYLIFSLGRLGAAKLFKLIRSANLVEPNLSSERDRFNYFLANEKLQQQVLDVMAHAQVIDMRNVERIEAEGW